jgi:hypothetical protein
MRKYQDVEAGMKLTSQSCGSCSLCCRLLEVPQAGKQSEQWCPHCKPGKGGCSIYETRAAPCRDWGCLWLTSPELGDEWFPKRCGMVLSSNYDADGSIVIRVIVDPRTPNVWREEPYFQQINPMAMRGLTGKATDPFKTLIVIGNSRARACCFAEKKDTRWFRHRFRTGQGKCLVRPRSRASAQ